MQFKPQGVQHWTSHEELSNFGLACGAIPDRSEGGNRCRAAYALGALPAPIRLNVVLAIELNI